jgi:hypothetical protein
MNKYISTQKVKTIIYKVVRSLIEDTVFSVDWNMSCCYAVFQLVLVYCVYWEFPAPKYTFNNIPCSNVGVIVECLRRRRRSRVCNKRKSTVFSIWL